MRTGSATFRVPRANLQALYGSRPVGSPYLDAKDEPAKLRLSPEGSDAPRNHEGIVVIGELLRTSSERASRGPQSESVALLHPRKGRSAACAIEFHATDSWPVGRTRRPSSSKR
jgi:hypothetical protein